VSGAPRELAPSGTLRVGINLGNPVIAQRDPGGGDPRGVGAALGRELARRAGVPVAFATYETAGLLADAVKRDEWDVAFLAIDPARAVDIGFTEAYVLIEGTYMVPEGSPIQQVEEVDTAGRKIAVGLKTAYDLYLTREIRDAQLVRSESSRAAIAQYLGGGADVVAGVRQPLAAAARANPGHRVLPGSFMVIRQAAGVPKARAAAQAYLAEFIVEAKKSGFVENALKESGQLDVTLAP
jgi:polar amino acid transport system substrate-binding protein